ncbi:pilus assembly PilX family protein [Chitiniphilus eburneus]|uniref:Type 4 fimbrial biogenesis protein PilX N-terminal domain-containing protein n=1 Tax=Chitiniphilus eburneus TaxID=2571148 RepID=A0A4U0PLL3_9NEIS|nr:hypothetical protein [Chitiniphilus eburneus]TJZ69016.1 hypothetical protein FAZ21_15220 [Chitiniphilus eburneus]
MNRGLFKAGLKKQNGILVLATAIFLLVVISLTALLSSRSAHFEQLATRNELHNSLARQAAQNGLGEMIGRLVSKQSSVSSYSTAILENHDAGNNWGYKVSIQNLGSSMYKLVSYGCADGCPSKSYYSGNVDTWENIAVATQVILIKEILIRDGALICGNSCTTIKGSVQVNGSTVPPFNKPAVVSGGDTVSASSIAINGTETINDTALKAASASPDTFTNYFFGKDANTLKSEATRSTGGCVSGTQCNSGIIYANSSLNGTYGTAANPVLVIVDAASPQSSVATVWGIVLVVGNTTSLSVFGTMTVNGQVLNQSGKFDATGSFVFTWNPDVVKTLQNQIFPPKYELVNSSWIDSGV